MRPVLLRTRDESDESRTQVGLTVTVGGWPHRSSTCSRMGSGSEQYKRPGHVDFPPRELPPPVRWHQSNDAEERSGTAFDRGIEPYGGRSEKPWRLLWPKYIAQATDARAAIARVRKEMLPATEMGAVLEIVLLFGAVCCPAGGIPAHASRTTTQQSCPRENPARSA